MLTEFSLRDLAKMFKDSDEFYFERYDDGFFEFICHLNPFPHVVTFKASPYAVLTSPCYIKDICASIDTAHFFSVKMKF
jgi:hypothetical protein